MGRYNRPEIVWPAAIIALLVSGMALTFGVLFFAKSDGGAQVIDRYYRAGVAWDSVAAARTGLDRAGYRVDVEVETPAGPEGLRTITVLVVDSTGSHVPDLAMRIEAFSPSRSTPVASADLLEMETGYAAQFGLGGAGLWDFELTGQLDGRPFGTRIRKEIYR